MSVRPGGRGHAGGQSLEVAGGQLLVEGQVLDLEALLKRLEVVLVLGDPVRGGLLAGGLRFVAFCALFGRRGGEAHAARAVEQHQQAALHPHRL
jgi:hypothetical protein